MPNITSPLIPLTLLVVFLVNCGGGYQAPIFEQGERQINNVPIIVSSGTSETSFPLVQTKAIVANAGVMGTEQTDAPLIKAMPQSFTASQIYRVRTGDNLMSIAFQYDLDFRALARANGLNPPYTIFIDQEINLDISRVHDGGAERNSQLGTAVSNNSVARSQATLENVGKLIRHDLAVNKELNWQWPHEGRILRAFEVDVNKGIDISGQFGDSVYAASDGDVVYSGTGVQGSGNLIIIRHSDKYLSAYAHNSVMVVSEGSRVNAGEKIAEIGQNPSGLAMLHFEIRIDGKSINPTSLLPRR